MKKNIENSDAPSNISAHYRRQRNTLLVVEVGYTIWPPTPPT